MKNIYNKGFTLIELLVVVLIIGILASIALPQYERAVAKSRAAGFMVSLKPLLQASSVCFLATGDVCGFEDMDVEVPECQPLPGFDSCHYGADATTARVDFYSFAATRSPEMTLILSSSGERVCCGRNSSEYCPRHGYTRQAGAVSEDLHCLGTVYVAGGGGATGQVRPRTDLEPLPIIDKVTK